MPLSEIASVAQRLGATFHLSWTTSGYRAAFVSRDGTGEIGVTRDDADDAGCMAVALVGNYTRPDGTVEWAGRARA